jgi:peroxin-12
VLAQRRPGLNRLLDSDAELFFLISVLLDRQSLLQQGSSFAESVYALKRAPAAAGAAELSPAQRRGSLILLTLAPYLKARLDALYLQHARGGGTSAPGAPPPPRLPPPPAAAAAPAARALQQLQVHAARAFLLLYPWANAAHEGARFAYQLFYLLGRTPYYSPDLHLLGLVVRRVSGQEAAASERARQARRSERLRGAGAGRGPSALRALRAGWARARGAAADHTRSALVLSVFAFKVRPCPLGRLPGRSPAAALRRPRLPSCPGRVLCRCRIAPAFFLRAPRPHCRALPRPPARPQLLEWWYTSAEHKMGGQRAPPPPPPPPAPRPAAGGVPLPADPALCALCARPRTNPALVATSGYAFCYPCAYRFVEAHGCCPVTRVAAGVGHVRRLYQGT